MISADIGGTMGLFIGASVITLVEVMDVMFHGIAKFYCRSNTKKKGHGNHHKNGGNML